MSKRTNQTQQILAKVALETTHREFKVFTMWFLDDVSLNASHEKLAERTGIDSKNIPKVMKSLVEKNILEVTGKYKRSQNYKLGSFFDTIKEKEANVTKTINNFNDLSTITITTTTVIKCSNIDKEELSKGY